ncbi:hypothetical protein HYH37_09425 [Clostridium botulinum]|uniref:hypothetical protein n=1 Tax=Clostridium botulinum TaxID=1491 RepID=UPI001C9A8C14|nr:hypothetical protein [Clostridium botulinum]MBY6873401.1 hypothetical protein [Clostridium botulinum]
MFNKNKEIKNVCKKLQEAVKRIQGEKRNKECKYLLKTYIDNIEDNRKILNLKCDEVIAECRKYREKL